MRPALEALAARTGESVNLGTRIGDEVLIVAHVASAHPLRFDQPVGSRVPVHASAMGKALLAGAADPGAAVAALGDLSAITGATLTTPGALLRDIELTQARGWSMNDGERDPGVRTIGAPVHGPDGRPIAAIAVQGPAIRMDDDRLPELAARPAGHGRGPLLRLSRAGHPSVCCTPSEQQTLGCTKHSEGGAPRRPAPCR